MAESSTIPWCHSTFNAWRGCQRVSPGCEQCYAEQDAIRNPSILGEWGPGGTRIVGVENYWAWPGRWNRQAERDRLLAEAAGLAHERRRVFSLSLGDWLEDWDGPMLTAAIGRAKPTRSVRGRWTTEPEPGGRTLTMPEARLRLLGTVATTPELDWLLLTKRIEGWRERVFEAANAAEGLDGSIEWVWAGLRLATEWLSGNPPANVWLLATVEDQAAADARIPRLLEIPAAVRGISVEPMLGGVDLSPYTEPAWVPDVNPDLPGYTVPALDWAICGGESVDARSKGATARPFRLEQARSLRDQCAGKVAFFMKQFGCSPFDGHIPIRTRHPRGEDMAEWPEDLRIREFPNAKRINHVSA